jgi:hypothetical protein
MSEPAAVEQRRDPFLIAIVAGALLLIAAGIGAVLVVGRAPRSAPADPTSPEGVVQAYVEAIRAGDADRAYELLSRTAKATTSAQEYRQRFPRSQPSTESGQRVLIETVEVGEDAAEVRVTFSRFSARPEPFSAGTYHRAVNVRLVREDGAWRIGQPAEPFPLAY